MEVHKIYRVLPDPDVEEDGDLRVIDESGEDYIFSGDCFIVIDLPPDARQVLAESFNRTAG